ncbi:MAG: hypothetical protein ACW99A_04710, partial [Candidatus Kariarchaeaceae archaeon]
MSTAIRDWCKTRKIFPNLFLHKVSNVGLFSISNVEAEIHKKLEPLEKVCLEMLNTFDRITRIEVHIFTGLSLTVCDNTLHSLEQSELIEAVDYDKKILEGNLARLQAEIGDDWQVPTINTLLKRKIIKQFTVTDIGSNAAKESGRTIIDLVNLDIMITGNPFYVFLDSVRLKPQGFDHLSMTPELTYSVLNLAKNIEYRSGIKPLSITNHSIAEGKEVVTSNYWISVESKNGANFNKSKFNAFLSSNSFDRWVQPKWSDELFNFIPQAKSNTALVTKSLESTFDMVEEVISEGLSINKDKVSWTLVCDLEMLLLISPIRPTLIQDVKPEVRLIVSNSPWQLILLLQLESYDVLADQALKAARFHASISRGGFSLEKGYNTWSKIMDKWGKKKNYDEYRKIIQLLSENDCLIESISEINKIYIDIDNILSINKRGKQPWNFSRIRQLETLLDDASITNRHYISSKNTLNRIDESEIFEEWSN